MSLQRKHVFCLAAILLASMVVTPSTVHAQKKSDNKDGSAEKAPESIGLSGAALAARLALEGEAQKSPLMLLTAADIMDGVKSSDRSAEGVKSKTAGKAGKSDDEKAAPSLDPAVLRKRALELASSDAERALLQQWLDRPTPRGLIYAQGKDRKSIELKGVSYKIVGDGLLKPSVKRTLSNVIFEGKKPAIVLVIGDGDGDLDLWVYDDRTDGLIGKDTDSTSVCRVAWTTLFEGPFRIEVANVGNITERYFILVNW